MQVVIIQARMGSKRLPGKTMMKIGKFPLLLWVVYSAKITFPKADLYVATSTKKNDDKIERICQKFNIKIYRGNLENVYSRFLKIININKKYKTVIRFTADNPLKNIFYSRILLFLHINLRLDYIGLSGLSYNLPEFISINAFEKSKRLKLNKYDKEHVTPIFYKESVFKKIIIPRLFIFLFNLGKGITIDNLNQYEIAKKKLLENKKYYKDLCNYYDR